MHTITQINTHKHISQFAQIICYTTSSMRRARWQRISKKTPRSAAARAHHMHQDHNQPVCLYLQRACSYNSKRKLLYIHQASVSPSVCLVHHEYTTPSCIEWLRIALADEASASYLHCKRKNDERETRARIMIIAGLWFATHTRARNNICMR